MEIFLMSSFLRQRGAVNILFLVFVLVVALAFGGLWFVELQANEDNVNARQQAEAEREEAEEVAAYMIAYYAEVARFAGGPVLAEAPPFEPGKTASEAAKRVVEQAEFDLDGLAATIEEPAARPKDFRSAWDPIIAKYNASKGEVAQLKVEVERQKGELAAKDTEINDMRGAHQSELQRLQEEWEATRSTLNSQLDDLRNQNDGLSAQVRESQDELSTEREKSNADRTVLADKTEDLESRVRAMHSEQRIRRATEVPDGKVIGSDATSGMCFIDVGSEDMLRRGTRFKVFEVGKGGARTEKGWITVTNTMSGKSQCAIEKSATVDAGDEIYNPIFDKGAEVRFCILGDLPGRYNKETAVRILERLGAKVEDNVNIRTDFVVLGMKEGEDADEITDRDDYRNAQKWGVEMIRGRDLQSFLQL